MQCFVPENSEALPWFNVKMLGFSLKTWFSMMYSAHLKGRNQPIVVIVKHYSICDMFNPHDFRACRWSIINSCERFTECADNKR